MAAKRGDAALVLALARGASVREAAREARLSERSAYRRAADADFRQEVSRARVTLLAQAVGVLADQSTAAARTLAGLLDSPSETIRLRAAVALLACTVKGDESSDVAERIAWLEDALAANLFETPAEDRWHR
ncbi:MAG TPA: hypothetical protein VII06_19145 [Chloroflexota bacterium]|jgi:hypothetical protein